jgi:hypothetical protein
MIIIESEISQILVICLTSIIVGSLRWEPTKKRSLFILVGSHLSEPTIITTHRVDHSAAPTTTHLRRQPICVDQQPASTTHLRRPPSCADHPAASITQLQFIKKPFPYNPHEKAVPIQPRRKSRTHSTQSKKPFPFNTGEKAVPIQLI